MYKDLQSIKVYFIIKPICPFVVTARSTCLGVHNTSGFRISSSECCKKQTVCN